MGQTKEVSPKKYTNMQVFGNFQSWAKDIKEYIFWHDGSIKKLTKNFDSNWIMDQKLSQEVVECKKSGENKNAKALWSLKEAKDKGTDVYDLGSVQQIQTRFQVRLALWAIHLKSLAAALANALERTEQASCEARGVWLVLLVA